MTMATNKNTFRLIGLSFFAKFEINFATFEFRKNYEIWFKIQYIAVIHTSTVFDKNNQ